MASRHFGWDPVFFDTYVPKRITVLTFHALMRFALLGGIEASILYSGDSSLG